MTSKGNIPNDCFHLLENSIDNIELPKKFTYPFYYVPHPLCQRAVNELQKHLQEQEEWPHNFGLEHYQEGLVIGKMFGVLIVKNEAGQLGYLAAFSGKLAEKNHHRGFVPPIYDILTVDGFYKKEELVVNKINAKIKKLEEDENHIQAIHQLKTEKTTAEEKLAEQKVVMREAKKARKLKRTNGEASLSENDFLALKEGLIQESIKYKYYFKDLQKYWKTRISQAEEALEKYTSEITRYKEERKAKSSALQSKLFDQYHFLNQNGKYKSLVDIFAPCIPNIPPAGAGECAAPKLLQYAYIHKLKPIALAEFWWGQSPKSQIRKHGHFYPACRSKCEPILGHMLQGLDVEENPMLQNPAEGKILTIVYEDEAIVVVNKPAEFLSVPGKTIKDSVYARIKEKYPDATGPLIVHRLDQSTSGILLLAKTKSAHENLQRQFLKRTIKKRYVALLDGIPSEKKGTIELPLRVDLDNRPHQLVCYEHGKQAKTQWKLKSIEKGKARIYLYPITGRTHQLRVHAAHQDGINIPIVGDDLYGTRAERLLLHAALLEFDHPVTKERMKIKVKESF